MRRFLIVSMIPLVLALSACGSASAPLGGNRIGTRSIPAGADEVVFRVDTRGGFTPIEYQLRLVPEVTVFGDGRVVVTGPETEQYPPHALPNLLTGTLAPGTMDRLARRAAELDLLSPHHYGDPAVADLPTTTVTIAVDGVHTHEVYALDFSGEGAPGLAPVERDARAALTSFVDELRTAATEVATDSYAPTEVAVYVQPATAAAGGDPGVEPGRADWPGPDLATLGIDATPAPMPSVRCAVLTGAAADTALAAARGATSITRWTSNGGEYTVVFRPLLADEHECP